MNKIVFALVVACVLVAVSAEKDKKPPKDKEVNVNTPTFARAAAVSSAMVRSMEEPQGAPQKGNAPKAPSGKKAQQQPIMKAAVMPPNAEEPRNTGVVGPKADAVVNNGMVQGLKEKFRSQKQKN